MSLGENQSSSRKLAHNARTLTNTRFARRSPLVKTAIAGNDPNVGRIAGAVGSWIGKKGKDVDFDLCNMESLQK